MLRKLKNFIKDLPINLIGNYLFKVKDIDRNLPRCEYDKSVSSYIKKVLIEKKKIPTITGVYRVKNGAEFIEAAILSIAPILSEIIIIDNKSNDKTIEIVTRLQKQLEDICTIKIIYYDHKLVLAGNGYDKRLKENPQGSLAKYYNFAFSHATSDYVMKCDAHYIFLPKFYDILLKNLNYNYDGVIFRGLEVYGKLNNSELFIYRNNNQFYYEDRELYESIIYPKKSKFKIINTPVHIHIKRMSFIKYINSTNIIEDKYK